MRGIRNISPSWIIHIFALLHAAVALICRIAGVGDELLLTVLTMAMSLLICYKKQVSIEFTAAVIIVGNIIGYLMGTLGASIFELIFQSPYVVHALSTAVTTEVLGWSIVAITKIFRQSNSDGHTLSTSYIRWILLAAGGIFVIRILIVLFFSRESFETDYILITATAVKRILQSVTPPSSIRVKESFSGILRWPVSSSNKLFPEGSCP